MTNEEAIAVLQKIKPTPCRADGKSTTHIMETIALDMAIEALEQEQKTGEWKEVYAETDYRNGWIEFTCENCKYQHGLESGEYDWHFGDPIPWKYCPMCGREMKKNDCT